MSRLQSRTQLPSNAHDPSMARSRRAATIAAAVLCATLSVGATANASSPTLVKDIDSVQSGSDLSMIEDVNGTAFLAACDTAQRYGLLTSDGTDAGTSWVDTMGDCQDGSSIEVALPVGDRLFYVLGRGILMVSDGTSAGTLVLPADPFGIIGLTDVDGTVFITNQFGIWKTDGSIDGTVKVSDVSVEVSDVSVPHLEPVSIGGRLLFVHGSDLWSTDGSPGGTARVKDIDPTGSSEIDELVAAGDRAFLVVKPHGSEGRQLWVSDGTAAGTYRVTDIDHSRPDLVRGLVPVGTSVFFESRDATHGMELWVSDGTAGGTRMVRDIAPDAGSGPRDLIAVGDRLFFTANDGSHGRRLWRTDGTSSSTKVVTSLIPTRDPYDDPAEAALGDLLYFSADGAAGDELWRTDGTPSGTRQVADIAAAGGSSPRGLTAVGTRLFFSADDRVHGREPWVSDGTAGGTHLVRDLDTTTDSSDPTGMIAVGPTTFLVADDGVHGQEPWVTDGTEHGTRLVKDIAAGARDSMWGWTDTDVRPAPIAVVGTTIYFEANDPAHGSEPWKSDGTPGGTRLVKDINPGAAGSGLMALGVLHGAVYIGITSDDHVQLWKSDGTAAGTRPLKTPVAHAGGAIVRMARAGALLYFIVESCGQRQGLGCERFDLWKTDGTAAGTSRVSSSGTGLSWDSPLTAIGDRVFFVASDGRHGAELWRTDGTVTSTRMVKDIKVGYSGSDPADLVEVHGTIFFSASGTGGRELWKSDGSSAGTVRVKDIDPAGSSNPLGLLAMGDALVFTANDGTHGREPWKSDGTSAGTRLVRDIRPGSHGSVGTQRCLDMECHPWPAMAATDDRLLLAADDGVHGVEPWVSDGTRSGTTLLIDLSPDRGSDPTDFAAVGGRLFFAADDIVHGKELWSYLP